MAENKKSVLLYCDLIHTVEKLDNETAGELFKHYLQYINDLNPTTENFIVEIAFEPIKQNLKRDLQKWDNRIEARSRAGKASVEARKNKKKQKSTKLTKVNNVEERMKQFKILLEEFKSAYSIEIINNFYLYWTEKKPNGKKMLFEMQRTFDIGRRLKRWSNNNFDNNKGKKERVNAGKLLQQKYGLDG